MKMLTAPRMERCIGCHSCSLACARLVHKNLSWNTAGIRIASVRRVVHRASRPAPASPATPPRARPPAPPVPSRSAPAAGVVVRKKQCIRCGECARACPVEAVYLAEPRATRSSASTADAASPSARMTAWRCSEVPGAPAAAAAAGGES